jgi:nucleoside-diphosphate-sugar epimerase
LIARGHAVIGSSRTAQKAARLRRLGAEPVILDVLDAAEVKKAVLAAKPDAIIHQATALSGVEDLKHFDRTFEKTNLLRSKGTDALVAAAKASGVRRFIAQSYTSWPYAREGGPVKTEADPLDPHPVTAMRSTLEAIVHLERAAVEAGGVALRYGSLYGMPDDPQLDLIRKRQFPIVGNGTGIWSFIHFEDAHRARYEPDRCPVYPSSVRTKFSFVS